MGWPWAVAVDEGRGHVAADEAGREWGAAAANNSTGPPRGDVVCVDKAARTAVGDVVADLAATGEGERCRSAEEATG